MFWRLLVIRRVDVFKATSSLAVIDSFDRGELADFFVPAVVEAKEVSDDVMVAKDGFGEHRFGVHSCVTFEGKPKERRCDSDVE